MLVIKHLLTDFTLHIERVHINPAQIYWETKAPDQNIFKYSCNPLQSLQLINYNYTRCQNIRQTGQKNESPATMLDRNLEKKKIN